jgi:hypothetical protein
MFDKIIWKFIAWVGKHDPDAALAMMGQGELPPHVQAFMDRHSAGPYGTHDGKRTTPKA